MDLETLSCNNCGAPLAVPLAANYVSCAHCGSRLVIKRTDTTHYTEVLERLDQLDTRTETVEAEVRRLRIDNAIMSLDDWWEAQRKQYMLKIKDGGLREPGMPLVYFYLALPVVALVISPVVLAFLLRSLAASVVLPLVLLFFLILTALAAWGALTEYRNYKAYIALEASYRTRRHALLNERQLAENRGS
jgi:DNA-directed RNA polymerase subunit RPC12/RpoP